MPEMVKVLNLIILVVAVNLSCASKRDGMRLEITRLAEVVEQFSPMFDRCAAAALFHGHSTAQDEETKPSTGSSDHITCRYARVCGDVPGSVLELAAR